MCRELRRCYESRITYRLTRMMHYNKLAIALLAKISETIWRWNFSRNRVSKINRNSDDARIRNARHQRIENHQKKIQYRGAVWCVEVRDIIRCWWEWRCWLWRAYESMCRWELRNNFAAAAALLTRRYAINAIETWWNDGWLIRWSSLITLWNNLTWGN
jgi:hypothetical protein